MRKIVLAFLSFALLLGSCKKSSTAIDDNRNGFWGYTPKLHIVVFNNGYGFMDRNGKIVITPSFYSVSDFRFGLAAYKKFNPIDSTFTLGYIDETGSVKITGNYYFCGYFTQEGLAVVGNNTNGKFGYINKEGILKISFQFDSAYSFHNGLAEVYSNGRAGFIDVNGNYVISPNYFAANYFNNGYIFVTDFSRKWGVIDGKGNTKINYIFDYINEFFTENLAAVYKINDGQWGYITSDGNYSIKPQFDDAYPFFEGLAVIGIGYKYGYIAKSGKIAINPEYDGAYDFSEGLAAVYKGGLYGFIDKTGKSIIAPQYLWAGDFSDGLAMIVLNDSINYKYIDKTNKIIWQSSLSLSTSKSASLYKIATIKSKQTRRERLQTRLLKGE
jgi:hypothetical protein